MGVTKDLSSTLLREGGEEVECLTIQLEVGQQELVMVNGYGPQMVASQAKKEKFWEYLDREVEEAARCDKMLVIQLDANSWLGNNYIPGDPNILANSNGKLFLSFLQRNPGISLVNSLPICDGVVTRQRISDLLCEKSVIDVFLVNAKVLPFVQKMVIDEKREDPLTNFHGVNKNTKITESDHNRLQLFLTIKTPVVRQLREEMFNFKDCDGQQIFYNITNNSEKLRNCFKNDSPFLDQASHFRKTLEGVFHQSFKKIRGTKRKRKSESSELDLLMNERKKMKIENGNKTAQNINLIENIEMNIAKIISEKNRDRIFKSFQDIANSDSSCNTQGMWRQMRKLFPKVLATPPSGIKDHMGKIITKTSIVKQIVIRKYQQRLRKRPANPEIKELMRIKEENARRVIQIARQVKTTNWSKNDLLIVLKKLKNGKCRDPGGIINEIFKPNLIGSDLQEALLDLFNQCKNEMKIPDFMQLANISNIWKKKGDKMDIDSYRGIFIVNIFRSLILRLIYQDKMKTIDSHITDFQIGGRKGRNVRDHLFVVNGLIQEALSSVKSKPINIIIADFMQCFDGLNLPLACKDLFISGCKDNKLALLYDLNKTNKVAVKTSLGITDRFQLNENVLQGDVFGNVLASNQIDKFGKDCLENEEHIFMYRNKIPIAPLTMCDDLLIVSECGYKTELMAAYINCQSIFNYSQFGLSKCYKMSVGKYKEKYKCQLVFLDRWKSHEEEDKNTGHVSRKIPRKNTD